MSTLIEAQPEMRLQIWLSVSLDVHMPALKKIGALAKGLSYANDPHFSIIHNGWRFFFKEVHSYYNSFILLVTKPNVPHLFWLDFEKCQF